MSNEQVCRFWHYECGCCKHKDEACNGTFEKCSLRSFQPREKVKVRKEVKAWACVDSFNTIYYLSRNIEDASESLFTGHHLIELTGTYEVEE